MIGDSISGILHLAGGGGWSSGNSATVNGGIEFTRTDSVDVGFATLTLNLSDTSFTLTFVNTGQGTVPNPSALFNAGLDGFEFTDPSQTFAGIVLQGGNTFPGGTFTSNSVTANNIHIFMNEPIIPGNGTTWTATWDVTFDGAAVPEPATFVLLAAGLAAIATRRRWIRRRPIV